MSVNILICGIGGQGTVLAAKLVSGAAMADGKNVLSAETIGMAQRGGSVVSHVRIGENCWSPLIPLGQADMMIAFEPCEAARNLPYMKAGGTVVVSTAAVQGVAASLGGKKFTAGEMLESLSAAGMNVVAVDTDAACRELGSTRVANMVLLGAACGTGIIRRENLIPAIENSVRPDFVGLNINALGWFSAHNG